MRDLLAEVKTLLKQYNLKSVHSYGQNFLIDEKVLQKILDTAKIQSNENIVEIGPGLGVLTTELAKRAKKVLAVEYDKKLLPVLEKIESIHKNLKIISGDILDFKNQDLIDNFDKQEYRVIANIPYQITAPLIRKFLTCQPRPTDMILMVQEEVAERIVATAGNHNLLALSVKFYAQAEIIDYVSSSSFYPEPKVNSAIIRIVPRDNVLEEISSLGISEKRFWSVVRAGFSSKRKKLTNNLANSLKWSKDDVLKALKSLNLPVGVRAQELEISQWIELIKRFDQK